MSEAVRTILGADGAAAKGPGRDAEAGFLWDFWYPAARSGEIRGNRLVTATLLEVPLVLGRTSEGKAFAMRDSCPHRGMPLSYGHFPCEERDGYVWVYMASRDRRAVDHSPDTRVPETGPDAPELPVFSKKYRITHLACELPSHVDQGIIGLMDPAHGPFVHQSWFWRSKHSIHEKQKQFEPIPYG